MGLKRDNSPQSGVPRSPAQERPGSGKTSSFQTALAIRFTSITTAGMFLCVLGTFWAVRHIVDEELNGNLIEVASIQAAALTGEDSGEMNFPEWDLTPEEAASIEPWVRYAQVWDPSGLSLVRNPFLTADLPWDSGALRAAAAGEMVWREADFNGIPVRSVFYPLARLGHLHDQHVLQVAASLRSRNATLRRVVLLGSIMVFLTAVTSLAGARWLASRAIRPVREIIDQAETMGGAHLERRIHSQGDLSETERLVQVLNTMLDRIQISFEAQRRFTSDASHELRSPLTAMRGELELALRRERDPSEYERVLDSVLEEAVRMSRIVEALLALARSDSQTIEPHPLPLDLIHPIREILNRYQEAAQEQGICLSLNAPDPVEGSFDPDLIGQMMSNLIQNALRFAGRGGEVRVTVVRVPEIAGRAVGETPASLTWAGTGHWAHLQVEDSGPGVPPGAEAKVFERFWRGDPARTPQVGISGSGLGLSIVRVIAEAHGGQVRVSNDSPLGGARFEVFLPAIQVPHPA